MQQNKVNSLIKWWVTPKLPYQDVYGLPLLKEKGVLSLINYRIIQWFSHPIKRRAARQYLRLLQHFTDIKVIGITGSVGKSTTSQMINSILKQNGSVVCTLPNVDSVYNIPNTILRCQPETKYLILEMSVEYPGEMDYYLWLAKPDIGVITNIYPTHTLFFKNEQGVLHEKSKLVKSLGVKDVAILNWNNNYLRTLIPLIKAKIIWFGGKGVRFESPVITKDYKYSYKLILGKNARYRSKIYLPLVGDQFAENSLAAAAVCNALGVDIKDIKRGLENFKQPEHRMKIIQGSGGALIVDDSYNNNPLAAMAALQSFNHIAGKKKKVVVFGDMLELGNLEEKYHIDLGKYLAKHNLDMLICVGKASKLTANSASVVMGETKVVSLETSSDVIPVLKKYNKKDYAILIKGSRSIGLDKIVPNFT
ncbi:hypothetical protein A3A76_03455 [Candidatus Woesebacteria bacterium RIFCSPLOWO2_01_FULL_39_23]|uniref:UDP-N-acetylmuramoyl-tripeptide--D-alanyl-D-alanine ligase n=1 Tax=Candidatus Woesebacteria bacterium RIFCSPHIGHO2_01_FULL_40_22 TaxID=1802499 RepID=A0A1F7YJR6_9BACT|nr:MAG: hypothetical protein A2141_00570 [Candidatus Woesebacteria bacterium RBG_16_40_11]OGM27512.1 MAG: hypothetical protein A2628_01855 [Candidatus Woesebacteria bacterium RIFCSPHIGHO2_01_FULL_40_22]OGM36104.1 MAG: hypothetical protein A3E41_02095 [Candidatus Woesebacteria bacterium RIFCSPHIGHO2_12_FULL_38_9]OGM62686.1 MAG: hypothetical protein A3A76_03455 [Candidatus Woesebacteria bacterium RIFCSPLOWO2_01_FULL_39_23]